MSNMSDPNSMQKIMRWVILVFIAYAFWHTAYGTKQQPLLNAQAGSAQTAAADAKKSEDCDKKTYPIFSVPLIPALTFSVSTKDIAKGTGATAMCGQNADIQYEYISNDNKTLEKGTKTIAIGDGQILHGAELGMLGMQEGGKRQIAMPPPLAFTHTPDVKFRDDINNHVVTARISLDKLSPVPPSSPMPLRSITTHPGGSPLIGCGDKVMANITIWKTDGTKFFSTPEAVTFTLGKSQVPYGIEQGLLGVSENSEQVIILPPAFSKPLVSAPDNPDLLPALPDNEVTIAQIEILHVGEWQVKDTGTAQEPQKEAPAPSKEENKKTDEEKR